MTRGFDQVLRQLHKWFQKQRQLLSRFQLRSTLKGHGSKRGKPWWQQDIKELLAGIKVVWSKAIPDASGATTKLLDLGDPRFRHLVLSVWFLLVTGLSGVLLWPVQISKHAVLVNERQMLESRFLRQQQLIGETPIYQRQIELILNQVGSLLDAVPEKMEPVHVLDLVNRAARDAGVQLELFRPMVETTEDYYAILLIEIRLTGDFHGLGKFMEKVSRMQHLITVDVSIVPSSTHENQLVMASLLKAYRNNMTQRALK
jgi:type IV pilus assembly protein PilO